VIGLFWSFNAMSPRSAPIVTATERLMTDIEAA